MTQYEEMVDEAKAFQTGLVDLDIVFYNTLQVHIEIFLVIDLLFVLPKAHKHLKNLRKKEHEYMF